MSMTVNCFGILLFPPPGSYSFAHFFFRPCSISLTFSLWSLVVETVRALSFHLVMDRYSRNRKNDLCGCKEETVEREKHTTHRCIYIYIRILCMCVSIKCLPVSFREKHSNQHAVAIKGIGIIK